MLPAWPLFPIAAWFHKVWSLVVTHFFARFRPAYKSRIVSVMICTTRMEDTLFTSSYTLIHTNIYRIVMNVWIEYQSAYVCCSSDRSAKHHEYPPVPPYLGVFQAPRYLSFQYPFIIKHNHCGYLLYRPLWVPSTFCNHCVNPYLVYSKSCIFVVTHPSDAAIWILYSIPYLVWSLLPSYRLIDIIPYRSLWSPHKPLFWIKGILRWYRLHSDNAEINTLPVEIPHPYICLLYTSPSPRD